MTNAMISSLTAKMAKDNPARDITARWHPFGPGRLKPWQAYGIAIMATTATLGLRLALRDSFGDQATLVIFTMPIMLSGYLGGLRPGLLATVLSCFLAIYYLLPPLHSFLIQSAVDRWQLFIVALAGVVISALNEALHRARRLADIAVREHLKAEAALLKAGALQSAVIASGTFSFIATDEKGIIQIFNAGAQRMLGYTAEDVMNKITPADLHDPQEVLARATALSAEFATPIAPGFEALAFKASRGLEDIYEATKIRKDGSRFPAVVSVTALRYAKDGIIGYLLVGSDNSARKRAEADRNRFFALSRDVFCSLGFDGYFKDLNPAWEKTLGYTNAELLATPSIEFIHPDDRQITLAETEKVCRGKALVDFENRYRCKDGSYRWFEWNVTPVMDDRLMYGVARDVTERKRVEDALQENNAKLEVAKRVAERANHAKSDFLSSMSHELRSPLNAILGFAQLMESASPGPTASQAKRIKQILEAGWYLLKLINEVLDLAAIESGKVLLSTEAVSLGRLMSECQGMMERQAQQCCIRMTFPHFDHPVFVSADRTRLKQIIINLLSNAIKYNTDQGTVVVECTVLDPKRIRIAVRDTGAGLPPEKLAQLFSPFNRLGQEAGSIPGTGIGLVVTKRLAELMGGVVGVESTVGVGSLFWCELASTEAPRIAGNHGKAEALVPMEALDVTTRRTLLYVEDNPTNLKLIEELIERFPGLQLLTAVDGTLGIERARAAQPHVILMDINLPGISGLKALKLLHDDPATAHIPVIALSANAMPRDIEKGLEAGFFRYVTKPINIDEFMGTLNEALEFAENRLVKTP